MLFLEFFLAETLPLIIDPIVEQWRPSFDIWWELFTDILRHKGNKIMDSNAQSLDQLTTIIQGWVSLSKDFVGMPEPIKSLDVEVRFY